MIFKCPNLGSGYFSSSLIIQVGAGRGHKPAINMEPRGVSMVHKVFCYFTLIMIISPEENVFSQGSEPKNKAEFCQVPGEVKLQVQIYFLSLWDAFLT